MISADVRESSAPADASDDGEPLDPRRRLALLQECRDLVLAQLSRFIDEALDRLSIELTITAMKAAGRESQQALLDALSLVRAHRNDIEFRFRQSFAELFEQRLFDRGSATDTAAAAAAAAAPPGGLALVDDRAIEDRIAIDRLVRRARRQLDPDEVLGVRARMAALLGRDWFDEDDYPASPEVVFEALRRSLDDLAPAAEVRTALLQAFEPHVATSLAGVHASVNERLRSHQVLPTIRPRSVVRTDTRRPGSPAADAARSDSPAATAPGVQSGAAGAGGGVGPAGAAAALRDFRFGGERVHAFDDLVLQMSVDQESARRSAARMLSDPETFGMADLPMPTVQPPLIEALHALQSSSREGAGAAPLATELLDHARSKGSSLDQLTVEIVSLVFDYIYADRRLPDPVKQQLLRLQVVAVKAALLDRSFFARRQHPMRRLIDRVTDLATDPDADYGAESTLGAGVADIVDWILGNFDDDLAVFDEAMARFDALAHAEGERRAARLLELTRQAERMEALAVAQEEASAEIALRIDPVTPAFVREFLYDWWSRALAQARIAGDCGGASWAQALQAAEMLIWSVAPKMPEEIPRLASLLPRMIGSLLKSLKAIGIADEERERFFNELLRWHTRAIQDAKVGAGRTMPGAQSAIRIGDDGVARFDASAAEASQIAARRQVAPPPRPAENAEVDALRRGDLIELADEAGATQTVRIAWISPTRKLYVLSRFPDFGQSLDRATLVSWFATGRASRAAPHSAVDSAIDAIARDDAIAESAVAG
ncbi:MAG: hypothetical protein DCC72_01710 [Burkholderiales bacterium]|nr:MAG: hypothetical protein DCC72_01710 [Burkholderiales bacterium]